MCHSRDQTAGFSSFTGHYSRRAAWREVFKEPEIPSGSLQALSQTHLCLHSAWPERGPDLLLNLDGSCLLDP